MPKTGTGSLARTTFRSETDDSLGEFPWLFNLRLEELVFALGEYSCSRIDLGEIAIR